MKCALDFRYLELEGGGTGVSTYCDNLLRSISCFGESFDLSLLSSGSLEGLLPSLSRAPAHSSASISGGKARLEKYLVDRLLLGRLARRREYDLVHFPHTFPPPPKLPCSVAVTIHDLIPLKYPASLPSSFRRTMFRRMVKKACQVSDRIITVSEASKHDICEIFDVDPTRISVVPNVIDVDFWKPSDAGNSEESVRSAPSIVAVPGRPKAHKNIEGIIRSFEILRQKPSYRGARLVLVGRGLERFARDSVDVVESLSREKLRNLYHRSDLLLFPSFCEGFGLPIVEAMAAGLPVVTSNLAPLSDIGGGGAAFLVPPDDPGGMAEGMEKVLSGQSLRHELVQKGAFRAERFSAKQVAPALEAAYCASQR